MRNLKRALSLALAFVMVMSMMVIGAGAVSIDDFTDKDEIVNTEAVTTMVSLGVIDGKDDGSYDPTGIVTRAEMAKLISVTLNGGKDPTLGSITANFTDTAGHWAEAYIAYVSELHIIDGRGDGTFGPNDQVTGAQAAKMILTMLGYRSDIEGFTGANWAINVQTKANDIDLFADMSINPDEGLTRDDTAQMLYNGVQSWMVEYRNLEGSYDGIVYPQPLNNNKEDSTVLIEKFKVRKVTGILEANDKLSVAGFQATTTGGRHDEYATALDGESLLFVTDVSGYSSADHPALYGPATYKIDTSDEMVGQEIVIYVKYLNDLSPNAASSTVVGTPILTDNNTVVETSARLKDAAAVRSALREGGMTNIGNNAVAVLYTENEPEAGITTGITDSITEKVRNDNNTRSAGIFQRFIDNDGNGYPDYIVQIVPVLTSVNSVNTAATKYTFTGINGTIDSADIVTDEALARNDVVLINQYADGKYYITYPETVEGAIESYNTNNDTISVDGTSYANSGGKNLAVVTGQEQILNEDMVDGTYIFYLDDAGNVLGALETEGVVGNYAVVQGWDRSGNDTMGYSVTVKLLMQDGSTGTYNLNLAATAVRLGVANSSDSTRTKEDKITIEDPNGTFDGSDYFGDATTGTDGGQILDHMFSYTLDGNTVTLARPYHVNDDRYASAQADSDGEDDLTAGTTLRNNIATYTTNLQGRDDNGNLVNINNVVANDQTVFFLKDAAGDYYVVTGLANLPSNSSSADDAAHRNDTPGIPVADSDIIAYRAPGSSAWIARAVFVETNNFLESVRDYVFVTDKYVTKNVSGSPVYTFTVVNTNGETSQMTTTSPNANLLKNTVREWSNDGSYVEFYSGDRSTLGDNGFTWHEVYISEIDGNVITLSDIDTGDVRDSYRVDGSADIWDVQDDEPQSDALQVNDIVGVYLDDKDIVIAAFIYDTMNGAYPTAPTSFTLNGAAMGGTLNLTTLAGTEIPVSFKLGADVELDSISAVVKRDTDNDTTNGYEQTVGTATVSVALNDANGNMEGTIKLPAGTQADDALFLSLTITQDGLDDLTINYDPVVLEVTASDAPTGVTVIAPEPFDGTKENTLTVDVTGGENLGYTWYVTAPAGTQTPIVSGQGGYTVNKNGSLTIDANILRNDTGDYTFRCAVVSNAGKDNVSDPVDGSVTVTPKKIVEGFKVVLDSTITGDYKFYGSDMAELEAKTDPVNGSYIDIATGSTVIYVSDSTNWNAGDFIGFGTKAYTVTAGKSIAIDVADLGTSLKAADFDTNIHKVSASEGAVIAAKTPGTDVVYDDATNASATNVKFVADSDSVTITGLTGNFYTDDAGASFTAVSASVDVSSVTNDTDVDGGYYLLEGANSVAITQSSTTGIASATFTAAVTVPALLETSKAYFKSGGELTVTMTVGTGATDDKAKNDIAAAAQLTGTGYDVSVVESTVIKTDDSVASSDEILVKVTITVDETVIGNASALTITLTDVAAAP